MNSIDQFKGSVNKVLEMAGFEPGPQCCAAVTTSGILSFALFIIGCAATSFSPQGIGYTTIGLAGGLFIADLATGNLKERKIQVLLSAFIAATFVTFGALGAAGILTANQVGWGILGTFFIGMVGGCGVVCKKAADIIL